MSIKSRSPQDAQVARLRELSAQISKCKVDSSEGCNALERVSVVWIDVVCVLCVRQPISYLFTRFDG